MRRHFTRTWATTVVATIASLLVVGPLHMVLEKHVWCPEHGEMVRAHDEASHGLGDVAGAPVDRDGAPRLPHSHDDDGCAWAMLLNAPGAAFVPAELPGAPDALVSAPAQSPLTAVARPIAVLALAPSHSPPTPV